MRHAYGLRPDELIIDNFAGGGGASTGLELAFGRSPDIAINHDPEAVAMHRANHPDTRHFCKSIYQVDPDDIIREYQRPIGFAWFSPDCTHHSKARGGKPREKHIRDLAWVVPHWAERAVYKGQRPRVIAVENVTEFREWGPLLEDGTPCPVEKGFEFQRWVKDLRKLGYKVDWRELRASEYGTPTSRKRLFVVARCDGLPIMWPAATHGKDMLPFRTAAECIDWSIPCPSIFDRERPLADNTLRRIAHGTMRYVVNSPKPFIVNLTHAGGHRVEDLDEPMRTITGANRGEKALVTPFLAAASGPAYAGKPRAADAPLNTVTADSRASVVVPTLIQMGYGEREGQAPRVPGLDKPLGTAVGGGVKHALVAAFLAKHYTGVIGHQIEMPIGTITGTDHHSLVASHLVELKGTSRDGQPVDEPMPTVAAQGTHIAQVNAFLLKYYGADQNPRLEEPLHTVTSKGRFGLVTVTIAGEPYYIADIGMRMLAPRELYTAQGFPSRHVIDQGLFPGAGPTNVGEWRPLTKTAQVRMCGNSVCPPLAAIVAGAQFGITFRDSPSLSRAA